MTAALDFRKLARQPLPPLAWTLLAIYFGYHLVQGERGLMAYARLDREVARAEAVLGETVTRREAMERRVALIAPEHIDPDMLDEQVRRVLGLAHPDDLVVLQR